MAAVNVASNGSRGWRISVDRPVCRVVRRWVDASIGRVGKRAVRSAVCSVRAAAAGGERCVVGGSERRDTRYGGDWLSLVGEGGRGQASRCGRWVVGGGRRAAGGGSRCEARTRVHCRARVMWRRAGVAGVSVGAVTRVVFSFFFRGLGKQTGWNCD